MNEPLDKPLHEQLKEFPCAFNLIGAQNVKQSKIKKVRHNIEPELAFGDNRQYELIRKQNLLTWVLFCLDKVDEAVELSNETNELTKCRNISCLGNRVYVTQASGDVIEATRCMSILQALKLEDNFQRLLIEAKSEQAYYYSRIGGPQNLSRAINLFSEAVAKVPQNYAWKFGLGLCYRRATHANIYCSSLERMDVEKYREEAIKLLLDVADNADENLKALAYAELTQVRKHLEPNYPHLHLFRGLSVDDLCKKALERSGKNMPSVLTSCGKVLKFSKVHKSIRLLEKSAAIKESSVTLHHLGRSYVIMAERMAGGFSRAPRHPFNCPWRQYQRSATPFTAEELQIGGKKKPVSSVDRKELELQLSLESGSDSENPNIGELPLPQNTCTRGGDSQMGAIGNDSQHNRTAHGNDISSEPGPSSGRAQEQTSKFYIDPSPTDSSSSDENRETLSGRSCSSSENESVSYADTDKKNETPTQMDNTQHINSQRCENIGKQRGGYEGFTKPNLVEWNPEKEVTKYLKQAKKGSIFKLNKKDKFVKKATNSYRRAIKIYEDNLPAVFDLGMLLKRTKQTEEALKQFNKVAIDGFSFTENMLTFISAHVQAGLCYLQLGKKEEGKEMLLKAVSLEASLAVTMPELEKSYSDIWTDFIKLINDFNRKRQPLAKKQEKIRLLKMVNDNKELAKVIRELLQNHKPNELQDQEIVKAAMETFLSLGRPEDSLTFQTLIGVSQAGNSSSWWNNEAMKAMKTKVMLHANYRRLKENKGNPILLFQQLFELSYGACVGMAINEEGETATNKTMVGDVLVVFDRDYDSSLFPSTAYKIASCFREVASCLFGLEAHENVKVAGVYGVGGEPLLNQMWKYHTVVVVICDERRSDSFKAILEQIPVNKPGTEHASHKILVLNGGNGEVPPCLKQCTCLRLQDIGGFRDIDKDRRSEDVVAVPYTEIVKQVFNGNIDSILKLFCFLTGGSWPLR